MSLVVNERIRSSQSLIASKQDVLELVVTYCQLQVSERLAKVAIKEPEPNENELSQASNVCTSIQQCIHSSCVLYSVVRHLKIPYFDVSCSSYCI